MKQEMKQEKVCPRCGRPIVILQYLNKRTGNAERVVCDRRPTWIIPDDDGGRAGLTVNGRMVRGVRAPWHPHPEAIPTYMPHRVTCPAREMRRDDKIYNWR